MTGGRSATAERTLLSSGSVVWVGASEARCGGGTQWIWRYNAVTGAVAEVALGHDAWFLSVTSRGRVVFGFGASDVGVMATRAGETTCAAPQGCTVGSIRRGASLQAVSGPTATFVMQTSPGKKTELFRLGRRRWRSVKKVDTKGWPSLMVDRRGRLWMGEGAQRSIVVGAGRR